MSNQNICHKRLKYNNDIKAKRAEAGLAGNTQTLPFLSHVIINIYNLIQPTVLH